MAKTQLRFAGAYLDPAIHGYPLGNGYRWYLPGLMRFNAPDHLSPFGRGGVHPYAYCEADPVNHRDPSGHMTEEWLDTLVKAYSGDARAGNPPVTFDPKNPIHVDTVDGIILGLDHPNGHGAHSPGPSGNIAADRAAADQPASPPVKRPLVDSSATEPHQPPSTSNVAPTAGHTQSRRFQDWFDHAKNNPTRLPGPGRSNLHLNALYSFAQDLHAHGMTLYSFGQYKLTLATRLNFSSEKALNDRIYNEYSMATDSNRRQALRLIADVIGSKLPEL